MTTQVFRQDNTDGYTDAQLEALNAEYAQRLAAGDWDGMDTDEAAHQFSDEVAGR